MAARSARAHQEASARARRRRAALSAPCGGTSPKGGGETWLSANFWLCTNLAPPAGAPPPKGEARLGSPFGGAVAVRRLRGQPASASTQPMRGGRWQLALSVLANASPPPPKGEARLGFLQTFSSAPTWLPPWGPLRPGGTLPSGRSPLPRRSVMGAAHWAASPEPAGESAPAGGGEGFFSSPPPRTCASLLMSTSGASCHRRESPGVQPPGSFCLVKGKSEVFFRDFSLFAGESGCFLQNPRAVL